MPGQELPRLTRVRDDVQISGTRSHLRDGRCWLSALGLLAALVRPSRASCAAESLPALWVRLEVIACTMPPAAWPPG